MTERIFPADEKALPEVIAFTEQELEKAECPILFASAKEDRGIAKIRECLKGKTTTVAGPSGVGKSSIINKLQKEVKMQTGEISNKIERGKHTTRHSELITVEEDTYILDTPGFTSLRMDDFEKEEIENSLTSLQNQEKSTRIRI